VEVHEKYGSAVRDLFVANGYKNVELKQDLQGKERLVRASISQKN
jgi:methylase of polypeptide subunit release factors